MANDTLSVTLEILDGGATAKLIGFERKAEDASKNINQAGKKIDFSKGLITDLDKAESRISQFTQRSRAAMDSFVGNLGANAVGKFTSVVTEGGKAILDYSSNLEQAKIGMTTMTGSVVIAERHLKDLQNFAKTTPFEFAELVTASQKFQGVGINALKIIPILTDVGNSLAAAGRISELPFATKAVSDIIAKGRLQGQEIIQLANAGIPALKILSGALGKTQAEIIELGEDGKISSDIFLKALSDYSKQNFGDAMLKQSRTFSGAMSNVKDTLYITSQTAFAPLYEKISGVSVELADKLSNEKDFVKVGETIAKSIAKGVGETLSEQISREIADIKAGKGNSFSLFNANVQVGAAFQEGTFGKRGNIPDLLQSSYNLIGKTNDKLTVNDLPDLEAINFFGKFDKQIAELKAAKKKLNQEVGKSFSENAIINGISYKFDAATNTLIAVKEATKEVGKELGNAAKEAEKLSDAINKFNVSKVDDILQVGKARIEAGSGTDLQKIRESSEFETLAIKEKIRLLKEYNFEQLKALTPEERNGSKGRDVAFQSDASERKLLLQQEILRLDTNKKTNDEIEKGKKKVEELGKQYQQTFDHLFSKSNSQNTFVSVFSEADKAAKNLTETLKGLSPELQTVARQMQQKLNDDSIFNARLDNDFASFDLRQNAKELRDFKPKPIEDTGKFFSDFIEAGLKQIQSANGGASQTRYNLTGEGNSTFGFSQSKSDPFTRYNLTGEGNSTYGFSQSDARNGLFNVYENVGGGVGAGGTFSRQKTFQDLTQQEKFDFLNKDNASLQQRLSGAFDLAQNRTALNDEQKSSIDRKIIALAQGVKPEQFTDRQRDLVATANEREAARREGYEQKAQEYRRQQTEYLKGIDENQKKLLEIAEKKGVKGLEAFITIKDETGGGFGIEKKPALKPAPTAKDTAKAYLFNQFDFQ
jgi:tape measure domain-containing protein